MHVHLVFVTRYRREVFTQEILDDLHGIFASVCADFEAELVEFDGEDDHVHLLVNYPPKVAVLLCWQLRRCTHRDHPPIHRTAADAALAAQRTPTVSALSFPGLKAEACRAPGSKAA